ncbi:Aspartic proteinase Asp1 [Dendrobium catenatum]|uniref:Aspartic proteinase Asp1 n=1 Tax=Dendrobium catenatum TaxID=906689 RepID=A0A2I0W4D1_9ASPA|nr:Aspartic proteinase Asp1 [Dendrobium catenatum]
MYIDLDFLRPFLSSIYMIDNGENFFRAFSPVSSLLRKIERRQKQKSQVMQPVTMAVLIAVVILFELPCFSTRTNSSSLSAIHRNPVSLSVAETTGNTDEHLTSNFVNMHVFEDVYTIGLYYVQIKIGDSSKPYNLHIDTGSDLTWLPKELYHPHDLQNIQYVRCDEPRCIDVPRGKCKKNTDPCDYKIRYQDEASSEGRIVNDSFTLHLEDGSSISPTLAIGRSTYYSSKELNGQSITEGMLGLGKGRISIISQLHEQGNFANIFGHCLSRNLEDYGFMFIGEDFDYPRCLTWIPMSSDVSNYSLMAEVVYGDHEQSLLGGNQVFVLDSGATDTYFVDLLYKKLLTKIA